MKNTLILVALFFVAANMRAQDLNTIVENKSTEVKNQQRTGTCWCYSTLSFLESELLREGKGEFDLAEMYVVKQTYKNKAEQYVMRHGKGNFSEGGQAHDAMHSISQVGIVPQDIFPGNLYSSKGHNHTEMVSATKGMLDGLIAKSNKGLSTVWPMAVDGILSSYLGTQPETFEYKGKTYSPKSFADEVIEFDENDYVELTSYSHAPFYSQFVLEVPDNWSNNLYYNLPMEDLMEVMTSSLKKGYTFVWDGDVSEKGFQHRQAIAKLQENESVSEETREQTFRTFSTTDDHLMHIIGLAEKDGTTYFTTKNSWGSESNEAGGLLYMTDEYVRLKTVAILVNKKSIPKRIAKKLFNGSI